jgi:hypothetical protein
MSNSSLYYRRIASYPAPLRLGYFIFLLLCLWVPFAVPLSLFFAHDPNFLSIVVMGLLFGQFLWFLGKWSQRVYGQGGLKWYGLVWGRKNALELLSGLIIGLIAYVGHNYLTTQIDKTANKMETASADFLDILQEPTHS